jgi:hypothetical protein
MVSNTSNASDVGSLPSVSFWMIFFWREIIRLAWAMCEFGQSKLVHQDWPLSTARLTSATSTRSCSKAELKLRSSRPATYSKRSSPSPMDSAPHRESEMTKYPEPTSFALALSVAAVADDESR